jgi:hypothetical protein
MLDAGDPIRQANSLAKYPWLTSVRLRHTVAFD